MGDLRDPERAAKFRPSPFAGRRGDRPAAGAPSCGVPRSVPGSTTLPPTISTAVFITSVMAIISAAVA
jgi:hypothetical protein